MKFGQIVCIDEISVEFKFWSCRSKTRSLCQILEKTCACCRGYTFSPILMKLGQYLCLDDISDMFEIGSYGVSTRSLGQILEKPCVCS